VRIIEVSKIGDNMQNPLLRHSGEGRNPGSWLSPTQWDNTPKYGFVRYAVLFDRLDSGLRRNDGNSQNYV
jgi:hypothetical protein